MLFSLKCFLISLLLVIEELYLQGERLVEGLSGPVVALTVVNANFFQFYG